MRFRFALALVIAALPPAAIAQQVGISGDTTSQAKPGFTGAPHPAKPPHRRRANTPQPEAGKATTPDVTHGATTGAAASVVKPPAKTDPQVHNLNTVLPP